MIIIHCDGGSRGNPGPAAYGVVVYDESHTVLKEHKSFFGIATNNVAEYNGLIKSLELAQTYKEQQIKIFMDSELVIRQVNGQYRVKAAQLKPLFEKVQKLKEGLNITFHHVRRHDPYQSRADALVNQALDEKR